MIEEPEITGTDFESSPNLEKFAEALAVAQGEIEAAAADSTNPHFGSKYADLASVIRAVRGPLARAKIARPQFLLSRGAEVGVRTQLLHASGQWMASTVWCKSPGTPQGLGSTMSYLRRYSLSAVAGVAQDDDDANQAEAETKGRKGAPSKLDSKTQARIKILQAEAGIPEAEWRDKLQQYYQVDTSAALSSAQAADLIGKLEARKAAGARPTQGAHESAKPA